MQSRVVKILRFDKHTILINPNSDIICALQLVKMFLRENLILGFKAHLKTLKCLGTTPILIKKDEKGETKIVLSSDKNIVWQWIKLLIAFVYVLILWIQMVQNKHSEDLPTNLESTMIAVSLGTFVIGKWTYLKHRRLVVELLNFLLQFERRHILCTEEDEDSYANAWEFSVVEKRLVQFCQLSGIMGTPSIIGPYSLQRWLNPCTSATLAFHALPECSSGTLTNWEASSLVKLVCILIFANWLNVDLNGGFIFQCFELALLQCLCLKEFTKWLENTLKASVSPNSQNFKVSRELLFRQLQILVRLLNQIQQDVQIVALMNMMMVDFTVCVYALLSKGPNLSLPHLIFFLSITQLSLAVIVIVFGTFAGVHKQSLLLQEYIEEELPPNIESSAKRRLISKYSRSFRPLKVNIGKVNFVEKCTPMVMLDFCFGQIVNLLLMG